MLTRSDASSAARTRFFSDRSSLIFIFGRFTSVVASPPPSTAPRIDATTAASTRQSSQ
jgi:hypothetical protein